MSRRVIGALVLTLALGSAAPGWAQVAWDSPILLSPTVPEPGVGVFLVEPAGGSLGVLTTWRPSGAASRMQFRAGIAEDAGGELAALGGIDASGLLSRASDSFPLDVGWVVGAGLGVGDFVHVAFPAGLIAGRTFASADGVAFTPYASPRIVVDGTFDAPGDGIDLDLAVDIGLDVALAESWLIRFGGTLGDREALAIGIVF